MFVINNLLKGAGRNLFNFPETRSEKKVRQIWKRVGAKKSRHRLLTDFNFSNKKVYETLAPIRTGPRNSLVSMLCLYATICIWNSFRSNMKHFYLKNVSLSAYKEASENAYRTSQVNVRISMYFLVLHFINTLLFTFHYGLWQLYKVCSGNFVIIAKRAVISAILNFISVIGSRGWTSTGNGVCSEHGRPSRFNFGFHPCSKLIFITSQ